jgi:hypothetical protein
VSLSITVSSARAGRPPKPKAELPSERKSAPPPANLEASQARRTYARQHGLEVAVAKPAEAPDAIAESEVAHDDDLAAVVVKKTLRQLASGRLEPSLRDGLIAQQLLDRREEKAQDRQFMLSLAQALAGGGYSAPRQLMAAIPEPQDDVVDGYFEEVALAPEHLRAD